MVNFMLENSSEQSPDLEFQGLAVFIHSAYHDPLRPLHAAEDLLNISFSGDTQAALFGDALFFAALFNFWIEQGIELIVTAPLGGNFGNENFVRQPDLICRQPYAMDKPHGFFHTRDERPDLLTRKF